MTIPGVTTVGNDEDGFGVELAADYPLDMRPTAANLFEMWRGRDIVEEIEAKHFEGQNARRIREAWERFCALTPR